MQKSVKKYLSEIGRKGGQKSRRVLTIEQAKAMRNARKEKELKLSKVNDLDREKDQDVYTLSTES
jgi:hypothetical protein